MTIRQRLQRLEARHGNGQSRHKWSLQEAVAGFRQLESGKADRVRIAGYWWSLEDLAAIERLDSGQSVREQILGRWMTLDDLNRARLKRKPEGR